MLKQRLAISALVLLLAGPPVAMVSLSVGPGRWANSVQESRDRRSFPRIELPGCFIHVVCIAIRVCSRNWHSSSFAYGTNRSRAIHEKEAERLRE